MTLSNGHYKITSHNGNPIGRLTVEDKSFRPKRVMSLPKDFQTPRIVSVVCNTPLSFSD